MSDQSSAINRGALSTVAASSAGAVTSVVLDAMMIGLFGMGWQTDAYFIATTIPLIVATLIALQAGRVIQPIFIDKHQNDGAPEAWRFVSKMITTGVIVLGALSLAGVFVSPFLIRIQEIGSATPASSVHLSTQISIIMFIILPLYLPIAVMRVVLNAFGAFALPGATKLFENAFKILFVIFLGKHFGIMALVAGMVCGTLFQTYFYYAILRKRGYRFTPVIGFRDKDTRQAYRLMMFPLAGQLCGSVVEVINNALGSFLGEGNVSALRLATRIIDSLGGLIAGSIITATMPAITKHVVRREMEAAKADFRQAVHLLLLVTVPLSIWLALTSRQLIALIYERQLFSSSDTTLVSNILVVLIPYIFVARLWGLAELPFFAAQDAKTPLLGSIVYTVLYIGMALLLFRSLGVYVLPLSRCLAFVPPLLLLFHSLRLRIGPLNLGALRSSTAKILLASAVMGVFILLGERIVQLMPIDGFASRVVTLGIPLLTGGVALLTALIIAKIVTPSALRRLLLAPNV